MNRRQPLVAAALLAALSTAGLGVADIATSKGYSSIKPYHSPERRKYVSKLHRRIDRLRRGHHVRGGGL